MAGSQNRSPVPARWRIVFATVLVLAFMFGGLLATLPDQKRFEQFEASLPTSSGNEVRR